MLFTLGFALRMRLMLLTKVQLLSGDGESLQSAYYDIPHWTGYVRLCAASFPFEINTMFCSTKPN